MVIKQKLVIIGLICLMLCYSLTAIASWIGPTEIMQGGWGSGDGEFGFRSGDTRDQFPLNFLVLSDGKIVIEDLVNNRLNIYEPEDKHFKSIIQPGLGLYELNPDKIVIFKWDDKIRSERIGVFSLPKVFWLWDDKTRNFDSASAQVLVLNNNIFIWDGKNGYQYSPTGQLLKTYTERPLELGVVKEESLGDGRYRVTIKYPDMTYTLSKGPYEKYVRICKESIYATSGKSVEKFSTSGEVLGELIIPEDQRKIIRPAGGGFEERSEIVVEYGQPVVAPTGDIYTWKRTPETYSILKWTWQGPPDAPQSLRAASSKTGIALTWNQPQKEANSVTGYEINRSGNVCGPFRPIGTVAKDVLTYEDQGVKPGETWYYQVRAMREKTPAGYSNKAVGTR